MSNKHYAVTDLHGVFNIWEQIQNYCDSTDTIYYLGDANDRGVDGLKIIDSLLSDSRVKYLKGDHEDMLRKIGEEYFDTGVIKPDSIELWTINGGESTLKAFLSEEDELKHYYIYKLKLLPIGITYLNKKGQYIFLSHAGMTPFQEIKSGESLENTLLWNRHSYLDEWPEYCHNLFIVHGHTPTRYLKQDVRFNKKNNNDNNNFEDEIYNYADGHKFDLDVQTWITRKAALFNLDELKLERYFYDDTIK